MKLGATVPRRRLDVISVVSSCCFAYMLVSGDSKIFGVVDEVKCANYTIFVLTAQDEDQPL